MAGFKELGNMEKVIMRDMEVRHNLTFLSFREYELSGVLSPISCILLSNDPENR